MQKMLDVFGINLFAALQLTKGVADRRINRGKGTSIVLISSIAATTGATGTVNYSASKASLLGAAKSLAKELAPLGVRVNTVLPGFVDTEMTRKTCSSSFFEKMDGIYPLGIGEVLDVAEAAVFLLSEKAKWITGSELVVDGGLTLGVNE